MRIFMLGKPLLHLSRDTAHGVITLPVSVRGKENSRQDRSDTLLCGGIFFFVLQKVGSLVSSSDNSCILTAG